MSTPPEQPEVSVPDTPSSPAPQALAPMALAAPSLRGSIRAALGDGLRTAFLLRPRHDVAARPWESAAASMLLVVLIDIGVQTRLLWHHAAPDLSGLPGELFPFALLLFCVIALVDLRGTTQAVGQLWCRLLASWLWIYSCTLALSLALPHLWPRGIEALFDTVPLDALWTTVATVVLCARMRKPSLVRWGAIAVVVIVVFLAPMVFTVRNNTLVQDTVVAEDDPPAASIDEATLYGEGSLLDDTVDAIRPGVRGQPTVFFVGFAGSDANTVFRKEVQSIRSDFEARYDTTHHDAVLINELSTAGKVPLATTTSLSAVLTRVGEVMDPERDVLFLYLSSHGSQESGVSVSMHGLDLDDIDPAHLKAMLDDAHIKNRVIVVSACHAGIFVPVLQNDDTLVMAAAAAAKTSFGCSNELDYTYFGRAYFVDGLSQTRSFEEAFAIAKPLIAEREKAIGASPSDPQIAVGARLGKYLDTLYPKSQGASDRSP